MLLKLLPVAALTCISALIAVPSTAQTVCLQGRTATVGGDPIAQAHVTLVSGQSGAVHSVLSAADGAYRVCDLAPGEFIHTLGDAHLYLNHIEQAQLQLTRAPRPSPKLILNPAIKSLFDFRYEDITLAEYDPHPGIKAPVAV